ncbi:low molecular weight protein-tyrosine-phosphatase [Pedobacter sp. Du54]|uniref:low molecular weight protein-tyrosine-phosphatase n=1 Tax=Pedobacter anseongensis TaxID=3133439 RepID=UPI0030B68768
MKILMVCMGNICRSPLAEGIMRHMVNEQNLDWEIASAGTGSWHVGKAPDSRGVEVAKLAGYDISAQRGRHFSSNLFDEYDHIFVMDKNNYKEVVRHAKNQSHIDKVHYFLADYGEVLDPYHHDHLFEPVFEEIEARCRRLIKQLNKS